MILLTSEQASILPVLTLIIVCLCFKGCRRTSSNKPLATDCNACRNLKNAITGECVEKCPEGLEEKADKTCEGKFS